MVVVAIAQAHVARRLTAAGYLPYPYPVPWASISVHHQAISPPYAPSSRLGVRVRRVLCIFACQAPQDMPHDSI